MESLTKAGLASMAILILAVVTLLGVVIIDNYGYAIRTDSSATDVALTSVLIGTPEAVGATGTYPYLQTATPCYNASDVADVLTSTMYSVTEGDEDGGKFNLLTAGLAYNNSDVNCSITYLADSSGSDAADKFATGLGVFATFCSIIALSIVGLLVIRIFRKKD